MTAVTASLVLGKNCACGLWKGGLLLLVILGILGNVLVTQLQFNHYQEWHKFNWVAVGMGINALIFMLLMKIQRRAKKHVV